MECKCGAETVYHEHIVKTLAKAQEWHPAIDHVPVRIRRDVCPGCGRQMLRKFEYPVDVQPLDC